MLKLVVGGGRGGSGENPSAPHPSVYIPAVLVSHILAIHTIVPCSTTYICKLSFSSLTTIKTRAAIASGSLCVIKTTKNLETRACGYYS